MGKTVRTAILRAGLVVFLTLGAAVAFLAWRLALGPITLPWLDRRIAESLGEIVPGIEATVERTDLVRVGFKLDVQVRGIRLLRRSGLAVASLPLISVRPSLPALLRGRVAVSQIGLAGVDLAVMRSETGAISLPGTESGAALGEGGLLALLQAGPEAPAEAAYLRRIYLKDASLSVVDRGSGSRWEITEVNLDLRRFGRRITTVAEGRARLRAGTFAGLRVAALRVTTRATAQFGHQGLSEVTGALVANEGEVAFSGDSAPPLPIRKLLATATFTAATRSLDFVDVHAEIGGGSADGRITVRLGPSERRLEAQGALRSVSAAEIVRLWPPSHAHEAREWIGQNIRSGTVARGRFAVNVPLPSSSIIEPRPSSSTPSTPPAVVDVGFDFEGLAIHYLGGLPEAQAIRGSARLDTKGFTAKITNGSVGALQLRGANVAIDYHAHPATIAVIADVDGPNDDLFALLDRPPLHLPTKIGIPASGFGGTSEVHAEILLPIVAGLTASQVRVVASAKVHEASQPALLASLGIDGAELVIGVEEDRAVNVNGTTTFTGLPFVVGPTNVRMRYTPQEGGGKVDASIEGPDANGEGTATFASGSLDTLAVERLRFGRSDLRISMIRDGAGIHRTSLDGERFDLESVTRAFQSPTGGIRRPAVPYVLDFRFAHVNVAPNLDVAGVNGAISSDGTHLQRAAASGRTAKGGSIGLELGPGPNGTTLRAHADHGGEMLHALGYVEGISGGDLQVVATIGDGGAERRTVGELQFTDFRVLDVPLLGKILSLGSFEGLASLLGKEGLPFSKLRAPFVWTDSTIEIRGARAFGSIGLTAEGTIDREKQQIDIEGDLIPIDTLNSALGKVPVVGSFITGKGSEIFGIEYHVRGNLKSPEVRVNPLSALAPGALRKMFSAVFSH